MDDKDKIVMGPHGGTSTSSYYIKIADKSTGTLTGDNVDSKLNKADRLLDYAEKMERQVNSESVNNLISAGQINASEVYFEVYDIPVCIFVENSFMKASNIGPITVYTAADINGKLRVIDEIEYRNCIITAIESCMEKGEKKFRARFRFTQRKRNLQPYNQRGQAAGNLPSLINFPQGTLEASGGGGGAGGGGGGGGG